VPPFEGILPTVPDTLDENPGMPNTAAPLRRVDILYSVKKRSIIEIVEIAGSDQKENKIV